MVQETKSSRHSDKDGIKYQYISYIINLFSLNKDNKDE